MFSAQLCDATLKKNSRVCVGLDPRLEWIPQPIQDAAVKEHGKTFAAAGAAILEFNKQIIDVVAPLVPAIKPQIAFYEQYGPPGLEAFLQTVRYAKSRGLVVIVDAKRGDIDSTAQAYANSLLGTTPLFGSNTPCYDVDCITVNPFLGEDSLIPFIETCEKYGKGIFILAKTSNPGSDDFQNLSVDGKTITTRVAELISKHAEKTLRTATGKNPHGYSNIGAVVGATFPEEARQLRKQLPHSIFLVPGIGSQGGTAEEVGVFFNADGLGAIVNASRGIVFSKQGKEGKQYLSLIEQETKKLVQAINAAL